MKTSLTNDHTARLEALRRAYGEDLPRRVRAIEEATATLCGPASSPAALEAVYLLVHRLTGSSAIYGFAAVQQAAAGLETRLASARESGAAGVAWEDELRPHLTALRRALGPAAEGREI